MKLHVSGPGMPARIMGLEYALNKWKRDKEVWKPELILPWIGYSVFQHACEQMYCAAFEYVALSPIDIIDIYLAKVDILALQGQHPSLTEGAFLNILRSCFDADLAVANRERCDYIDSGEDVTVYDRKKELAATRKTYELQQCILWLKPYKKYAISPLHVPKEANLKKLFEHLVGWKKWHAYTELYAHAHQPIAALGPDLTRAKVKRWQASFDRRLRAECEGMIMPQTHLKDMEEEI